jgi:hypothetical protein
MLFRDRDLQAIKAEKRQFAGTMNVKINNVIYMEIYSGAKIVDDKYEKTNIAGSIDREFTVMWLSGPCVVVQSVVLSSLIHTRGLVPVVVHRSLSCTT